VVDLNKSSLQLDGTLGEGIADAKSNTERGLVVCSSVDPAVYAVPAQMAALFGAESYHGFDYGFHYQNLQGNVKSSAVSEKEFEAEKGSLNRFSGSGFGNTSPAASRALPNLFRFSRVFAST
jgi:hypothetical protein